MTRTDTLHTQTQAPRRKRCGCLLGACNTHVARKTGLRGY